MTVLQKVSDFISRYDFQRLGVAVSGGADSICLLTCLFEILEKKDAEKKLMVITVNHNIREESETKGDALFVSEYCKKLGVECKIVEINRGEVFITEKTRCGGTEDAARFLRYKIFEQEIAENNLDYVCLAHNENDNLETILMRFFQGSGKSGEIEEERGRFLRPLLKCSRNEIEDFLKERKLQWRTDSTNFDNNYLRNKIRNILVPVLNENFEGWKTALLHGVEKKSIPQSQENLVFEAFKNAGGKGRLPFPVIKEFLRNGKASFDGYEIFAKKKENLATEINFYSIIEEGIENGVSFKTVVRNARGDDVISGKDGEKRSVLKILKNWKIPEDKRKSVPVVERIYDDGRCYLTAILGKSAGAQDDFIVKNI